VNPSRGASRPLNQPPLLSHRFTRLPTPPVISHLHNHNAQLCPQSDWNSGRVQGRGPPRHQHHKQSNNNELPIPISSIASHHSGTLTLQHCHGHQGTGGSDAFIAAGRFIPHSHHSSTHWQHTQRKGGRRKKERSKGGGGAGLHPVPFCTGATQLSTFLKGGGTLDGQTPL